VLEPAHPHAVVCDILSASLLACLQVQELELGVDGRSMARLLEFLQHSFSGGTDVDKPFELALQRLQKAEWSQVGDSLHPLSFGDRSRLRVRKLSRAFRRPKRCL